jgi:anti-sigma regulatory factor (Ser/Thr protein kinase)
VQTRTAETELAPQKGSLAEARRFADHVLQSWGWNASRGGLHVVLTELVSNAIQHGEGPVRIQLELRGECLRLGVRDNGAARPAPRPSGAGGGFGLKLVEKMCANWHTDSIPDDGKTVWCVCPDTGTS